jgi:hypothetical protein
MKIDEIALSDGAERLVGMMRRWELNPAGTSGLQWPAPERVTTAVLAERLSLTERGTSVKVREAISNGLVTLDVQQSWQLTTGGRKYADKRAGRKA